MVYAIGIVGVLAVFAIAVGLILGVYNEFTRCAPEGEDDPYGEEDRPTSIADKGFRQDPRDFR